MSIDNLPDLSSLSSDSGIGDMIGRLMSRPDLIQNIASELGLSSASAPTEQKEGERIGESAPASSSVSEGQRKGGASDKERLLLALKPYLSDKRRDAVDMMLKLESLASLFGKTDPDMIKTLLGGIANV